MPSKNKKTGIFYFALACRQERQLKGSMVDIIKHVLSEYVVEIDYSGEIGVVIIG